MGRIIKLILIFVIFYITYNAYEDSKINGKSFYFNFGYQFKKAANYGYEKTKTVFNDIYSGAKK